MNADWGLHLVFLTSMASQNMICCAKLGLIDSVCDYNGRHNQRIDITPNSLSSARTLVISECVRDLCSGARLTDASTHWRYSILHSIRHAWKCIHSVGDHEPKITHPRGEKVKRSAHCASSMVVI